MTSTVGIVDLKEDISKRTIHPPSLTVIAFNYLQSFGGGRGGGGGGDNAQCESAPRPPVQEYKKKPGLDRVKTF